MNQAIVKGKSPSQLTCEPASSESMATFARLYSGSDISDARCRRFFGFPIALLAWAAGCPLRHQPLFIRPFNRIALRVKLYLQKLLSGPILGAKKSAELKTEFSQK